MTSAYEEEWREEASCLTSDPELWFPKTDFESYRARQICANCPVIEQCLNAAIVNDEKHGIWAGLDYKARHKLQKGRAR